MPRKSNPKKVQAVNLQEIRIVRMHGITKNRWFYSRKPYQPRRFEKLAKMDVLSTRFSTDDKLNTFFRNNLRPRSETKKVEKTSQQYTKLQILLQQLLQHANGNDEHESHHQSSTQSSPQLMQASDIVTHLV